MRTKCLALAIASLLASQAFADDAASFKDLKQQESYAIGAQTARTLRQDNVELRDTVTRHEVTIERHEATIGRHSVTIELHEAHIMALSEREADTKARCCGCGRTPSTRRRPPPRPSTWPAPTCSC